MPIPMIGGFNEEEIFQSSVLTYNVPTNEWDTISTDPIPCDTDFPENKGLKTNCAILNVSTQSYRDGHMDK